MQFHNNTVGSIDESLSDDEMHHAWEKMIQQSAAWKKHAETHDNAHIVGFDEEKKQEEILPEQKKEEMAVKYDAETGKFPTATCSCGQRFEMHGDAAHTYNVGNLHAETSPYSNSSNDDKNIYTRGANEPEEKFFSYKRAA